MEERRTISISYRADLQDLIKQLKELPNITEQQAQDMVNALDNQLQSAEEAARRAAEAAAEAASRAAEEIEGLEEAADDASSRLDQIGESGAEAEGAFGSLAETVGIFNPELSESIQLFSDASAAGTGLLENLQSMNPIMMIATGIIAGLVTIYTSYEAELSNARELTLELREAQNALNDTLQSSQENLEDAANKLRMQRLEFKLLTGQISEYEYNLEQAGESANEAFITNIQATEEAIENNESLLKTVKALQEAYLKGGQARNVALSEDEKDRLRTLQLQQDTISNTLDLTDISIQSTTALLHLEKILVNEISQEEKKKQVIQAMQEESVNLAMEMVTLEKELADANEEAAEQAERRAQAAEKTAQAEEKTIDALEEAFALSDDILKEKALQDKMDRAMAEAFLSDEGKKKLAQQDRINAEIEAITRLGIATDREAEAAMAIEALRHQGKMENLEKEEETILGITESQLENSRMINDSFSALTGSLQQLMEQKMEINTIDVEAGRKQQEILDSLTEKEREALKRRSKAAIALFQLSKAASLAEVAMTTAENVAKAQGYGPVLAPIMTGFAIATGTAQAAVIASQPAPQVKFHMGGMAPDEMGARVLRGEAVLDRATVRRIGGEQGVRNLQQGEAPTTQTVVIQPFKHFGRFAADLGIRKTKQVGIRGY